MTSPRRGSGDSPRRGAPRNSDNRGGSGRSAGRPAGSSRQGNGGGATGGDGPRYRGGERPQRPAGVRGRPDPDAGGSPDGRERDAAQRRRPAGDRPQWQDRRPSGERSQGRGDRPQWQDRRPSVDRPQWQERRPAGERAAGGRQAGQNRPASADRPQRQDRRPSGDRPQGRGERSQGRGRRTASDRPEWQDRRSSGGRPGGQDRRPSGDRPQWQDRRPSGDRERGDWRDRRPSDARQGGRRATPAVRDDRPPRPAGPELPDWADPSELDSAVRSALRGLDPRNADRVARHLVVAGSLVDDEPGTALEHARAARDRASRVAAVREAVGVAAYHAGDYAEAARELRAYRRMSGDESYRAVLADCERALGRPDVALRLVAEAVAAAPDTDELAELRLVEAGARRDLGELAAARLVLEDAPGADSTPIGLRREEASRLRLAAAYADLLRDLGDEQRAAEWSAAVAEADPDAGADDVLFSEEEVAEVPVGAVPDQAAELPADDPDTGAGEDGDGRADEVELDLSEDIEAEVADLLG